MLGELHVEVLLLGRMQRRRATAGAQALDRERKVSLMRKYRTGELPDVQQVTLAAFLAPLGNDCCVMLVL